MNSYDKIRKAINTGDSSDLLTAMDALDAMEKAASEPVGDVNRHCVTWRSGSPPHGAKLYTAPPPAPVAAMREPTPTVSTGSTGSQPTHLVVTLDVMVDIRNRARTGDD